MYTEIAWQVFFELHSNLPREGPGNDESTAKALAFVEALPDQPQILDLGCGPGMQTLQLARLTHGHITAVDNHQPYLDQLQHSVIGAGLGDHVTPLNADMASLPFAPESFDLIWAEGSAYNLGFQNALQRWRSLLKRPGYLAVTEIAWIRPDPPPSVVAFWQMEYPNMQSIETNVSLIRAAGYSLLGHFILPEVAWWQHYYTPLEQRLQELQKRYADNPDAQPVLASHAQEIELYRQYADYYGYVFYSLQKED